MTGVDPIYQLLRQARQEKRLSLTAVEAQTGGRWKTVVVGSYERGDRHPNLPKLRELLGFYGYGLVAIGPDEVVVSSKLGGENRVEWVVGFPSGAVLSCTARAEAERLVGESSSGRVGYRTITTSPVQYMDEVGT